MTELFDPARHEALTRTPCSESAARHAIARIAGDALLAASRASLWPAHALDEPDPPDTRHVPLYHGAGGMIWALQQLRRVGAIDTDFDFSATLATLLERNRTLIAGRDDPQGSLLFGDAGLLSLQWQSGRDEDVANALFAAVEANLHHRSLEPLWRSPGSLLATVFMAEASGEARWRGQLERGLRILGDALVYDESLAAWLWVQDLYGKQRHYLGAGHGLAGNLFPALRRCRKTWSTTTPHGRCRRFRPRPFATAQASIGCRSTSRSQRCRRSGWCRTATARLGSCAALPAYLVPRDGTSSCSAPAS
jgi:hypothetical protein